jgi:hypothetical protein
MKRFFHPSLFFLTWGFGPVAEVTVVWPGHPQCLVGLTWNPASTLKIPRLPA